MGTNLTGSDTEPTSALLAGLTGSGSPGLLERGEAVRVGAEAMSGEQLLLAAGALAQRVQGASAVAIEATTTLQTVVAVVGCLLAGVPAVPIPADSGAAERAHLLSDSGAEIVLGQAQIDLLARADWSGAEPSAETTALILYTSGTTGAPKGVPISRAAIAAGLDALAEAWAWTPQDTLVHGLPLFHVHGLVLGVLGALRVGSPLVHTGRPTPALYAQACEEANGSLFFAVPTVWSRVCAEPSAARALRPARLLVSGSAPLPVPVFEQLAQLSGHRPLERYGMTETLVTVSSRADGERRPGQVGVPVRGVETRLFGDDGLLPADGEAIGDLQVRAPMVFEGYLHRPEASAACFTPDGWFRTGDVARIGPDGWHQIVGRASTDLIKSGGYRIGAGEVEDALLAHPGVREAAVVGLPDDDLGQRVTAFVVADGVSERALIDHVGAQLSIHKRPRHVFFVDALPRNPMGKVLKTHLHPR